MPVILKLDDFANGIYKLPLNPEQEIDLIDVMDKVENEFLFKLFGVELAELFLNDWAITGNSPTAPRFQAVYNPFNVQHGQRVITSLGILEMLKAVTYYQYVRTKDDRVTTVGIRRTKGENSDPVTAIYHATTLRYNDAISTYKSIQWYMRTYKHDDYPEFKGMVKFFESPF